MRGLRLWLRRRWVRRALAVAGAMAVLAGEGVGFFVWAFVPFLPTAHFDAPVDEQEAYLQDLSFLERYADYEKALEDPQKRQRFLEAVAEAKKSVAGMTPGRFEAVVALAVAQADNGHSNVSPVGRTRRVSHMGVRLGPFEDGQFVLQARPEHVDLLGAEMVAIEGRPVAEVVDGLVPYFGGVERRSRLFAPLLLTSPELLHGAGFSAVPEETRVSFLRPDGVSVERVMEDLMPEEGQREPFGREVMEYRAAETFGAGWAHLMTGREPPLSLAEPDEPYLYRRLAADDGAYVRINYNQDMGGRSLTGWLAEVADDLAAHPPAFAIVDLRFNGGGTDATADFARALPDLIAKGGPIYVLTSRETFSAGIGAAAQLEEHGGERTHIVGGEVGDRLRFVGNGGTPLRLPNSGITVYVWSAWEDYADGCWEWLDCFWFSPYFRHRGVGDLRPDLPVTLAFRDYVEGRDAFVEKALADFRAR